MAAPLENEFWKLRSKHGRDKLFATPALLEEAAYEYFAWCQANPWIRVDFMGKDADRVEIPTARPFTIQGLCLYLNVTESWFRDFRADNKREDFSAVISRIDTIIYTQKFEGAVVGAFNANIISRDLGLVDKKELSGELKIEPITGMRIVSTPPPEPS